MTYTPSGHCCKCGSPIWSIPIRDAAGNIYCATHRPRGCDFHNVIDCESCARIADRLRAETVR